MAVKAIPTKITYVIVFTTMMCRYPSYHSLVEMAVFLGWGTLHTPRIYHKNMDLNTNFIMVIRQETDMPSWSVASFVGDISSMNP